MGRKKLPIGEKRLCRQYYLTAKERKEMDEFFNKMRGLK